MMERQLNRERLRNQKSIKIDKETEIKVLAESKLIQLFLFAKLATIWQYPEKVCEQFKKSRRLIFINEL